MMMSTALANSVHFENWTANHVAEWLRGLDDVILPYVHFFLNNGIDGKKLMLLTPFDLEKISIMKVGHQELILEAVDLLKSLRYGYETETLQHLALQLGCKARSLHNEIQAKSLENDKNRANISQGPPSRRLSIKILSALADLSMTLKNVVSWLDRSPFESMYGLCLLRNTIVKLGIDLVSSYQKDSRQTDIEENISKSCMILTEVCDELVIKNKESLVVQPASLEQATIRKKPGEELGMHIQSSYYGIHVIGGIKEMSPADLCGKIEKGDEVIQVNHKTVVGWQLTKLVNSLKEKPKEVVLVLKKRPHHIMPYGHVANKKKQMTKVAVSTLPKSIKKRRSREGGDPKQVRPSLQELVSTVQTDDMDSPREERTSDEKDDGNDTDNDVFRSGSESPQYVKPSVVDPKQRRATVSGGSPTLSRTLLGPEDIETPTRPKSFTVSATDAPQIEYRDHGIPGEDSNLLRLGDANKIINAHQKRQEFRTAKSVPQSLEFVVKKPTPTVQEPTPRLRVTRADQNIELITDPPDPDDQSASLGLLEVPSRFQNFATGSQGTDEEIDTSDTQPHISATSSSDTLTEDTVKSEENLRVSHSPQPSLSPQPPSLSPQPLSQSSSQQPQSHPPQPKSRSTQSQSRSLQSQSNLPQPECHPPQPQSRSLQSKESSESGISAELSIKHTPDQEVVGLGDLPSEEDVGEVFAEETMPGVAAETASTETFTDQKMDANYNNATQEATNTSATNNSEILDPNGNTSATATDNQNLANANNNLNLRSQSSLNKFDPITNKPIPAERHSIKPSIPRTSAKDGLIEARAVDLEKPRQTSDSGEVAFPQKQKNQPQLMGYRKIGSFTQADKDPPGQRWSASSSPGSQRRSDASLDSVASSVLEESANYKVVIVSGVPQRIPLEKTPSMESSGSVILRPKKTKKVDRRVSCRDLGEGDCQGWLWKGKNRGDGPLSRHWLKRWCVLKHQNMFFFKDKEDMKAEGVIHLPAFQVSPASKDEVKTKKFAFKVHNAGTTFIFASERIEDMSKWMVKFGLASIGFKPTPQVNRDHDPSFSESDEEPDDGSSTSKNSSESLTSLPTSPCDQTSLDSVPNSPDNVCSTNTTIQEYPEPLSNCTASMQESTEDLGILMRQIQRQDLTLDGTDRGKQRKTLLSIGGDDFPSRDTIKKVKQLHSLERTVRAKEKELAEIEKLLSLPSKCGLKSFQEAYMKTSPTEPQSNISSDSDSEVSSYI
ncbi:CNK3/IPCEF1 fusion protein-like isoform X2 [Pecten maximus]|uniref:CNK3/IPCEF1 fusion protein-like isoform X2 n=1 Tax=Pecten maximus TaxID=6579 RepID=UPI001457FB46|nr:CNK3/IPCEF1 fusion protein-like isoform X2 [Pecten maximus]